MNNILSNDRSSGKPPIEDPCTFGNWRSCIVASLLLLVCAKTALAIVPPPPTIGTSATPDSVHSGVFNAALNSAYSNLGRVNRLEREVDRLETGFTVLAVLVGSSLASLCVLAARDHLWIRKHIPTGESHGTSNGTPNERD